MKRTTVPLIVSGLKLWPLVHCVTYGLIPVENRVLWVDAVEILWVTILATQAAGGTSSGASSHSVADGTRNEHRAKDGQVADEIIPGVETTFR